MNLHLEYIGKQQFPGHPAIRLWNVILPGHQSHNSTLSVDGLREWGLINGSSSGAGVAGRSHSDKLQTCTKPN